MTDSQANSYSFLRFFRMLIRLSFLTTIILTFAVAWQDIQASQAAWWLIMGVMLLPLLSFSHTVYSLHTRGLIWLCFVLCLYFTMSSVAYISTANSHFHGLLALSTTTLFIAVLGFVKIQAKNRKRASFKASITDSPAESL